MEIYIQYDITINRINNKPMIKIFELTQEKQINNFLKKHPFSTIVSYSPKVVIDYHDTKYLVTPYRTIKFSPIFFRFEADKLGDENYVIKKNITKIFFFDDFMVFGDIKIADRSGRNAYYICENYELKARKITLSTYKEGLSWTAGVSASEWDYNPSFGKFIHDILNDGSIEFVECDEEYKYDTRTKSLISIGKNIKSGLDNLSSNLSTSIIHNGNAIASSIGCNAHAIDNLAYSTATGNYRNIGG